MLTINLSLSLPTPSPPCSYAPTSGPLPASPCPWLQSFPLDLFSPRATTSITWHYSIFITVWCYGIAFVSTTIIYVSPINAIIISILSVFYEKPQICQTRVFIQTLFSIIACGSMAKQGRVLRHAPPGNLWSLRVASETSKKISFQ